MEKYVIAIICLITLGCNQVNENFSISGSRIDESIESTSSVPGVSKISWGAVMSPINSDQCVDCLSVNMCEEVFELDQSKILKKGWYEE